MKDWECVYTRAECHHEGTKCSECPLTDLICDEFTDCLDITYEQGKTDALKEIGQIIHNIYTQDLYCMGDLCEKEKYGHECEDCLYHSIKQNLEQLKGVSFN